MEIFETHAHLADESYSKDFENVIKKARQNSVVNIMCVGANHKESQRSVEIAMENQGIFASVGIHPSCSDEYNSVTERDLKIWLQKEKVLAVGEIGLDYYRDHCPRSIQDKAFRRQLDIACEHKKPVIMHCREAYQDLFKTISTYRNLRGVVHCFSGSVENARELTAAGFYIGITGIVTFPKAFEIKEVVKEIPLDKILLETDCPYITPVPLRGQRNEPANIIFTAKAISEIKGITLEETAFITTLNAKHLFNLLPNEYEKIAYELGDALYLNLTNRCMNLCKFCRKTSDYMVGKHFLKLEAEPDFNDVINSVGEDVSKYKEIVFCGYGEPTIRIELVRKVAAYYKNKNAKIRLNTNGLGNLYNKRDILPDLKGIIDVVSVSLNAHNAEVYNQICRPDNQEKAYSEVIDFIYRAKKYVPEVIASVVNLPEVDIEACRKIADNLGVKFRIRHFQQ